MFEDCSLSVIAKAKYNNSKTVRTQTPSIYRPRPRRHTRTLSHTHTDSHTWAHTPHTRTHTHHTHTHTHTGTHWHIHTRAHTHTHPCDTKPLSFLIAFQRHNWQKVCARPLDLHLRCCQLKGIWPNQYLSVFWHTQSWLLEKSFL